MNKTIKILVVNGSPKGEFSLTLQHSLYMLGQQKDIEFKVLQAGEALSKINFEQTWLNAAIAEIPTSQAANPVSKATNLRTVLLTDEIQQDGNLSRMLEVFIDEYPHTIEVVDINDFPYEETQVV